MDKRTTYFVQLFKHIVFFKLFNYPRISKIKVLKSCYYDDFYFKGRVQYFSISSETTLDKNSNSFASFSWRFGLVLPPYFVCVRQPEVTGKPEVNRKTVRTARWCDIFIFSNMPYPDEKRWYYTRDDAFNLILKSDFH